MELNANWYLCIKYSDHVFNPVYFTVKLQNATFVTLSVIISSGYYRIEQAKPLHGELQRDYPLYMGHLNNFCLLKKQLIITMGN